MERTALPAFGYVTKSYSLLTKPRIIMGNIICTAGGLALASRGSIHFWLFMGTLLGLSFVIASACVFNNFIDREADKKMARTQDRALASGTISVKNAILFALSLGLTGSWVLYRFTNLLTVGIALFGFVVYVLLYSYSKYHSMHGTLIGSVAGAVPPVVGYCAVSNQLDLGAMLFFLMMVLWQMPHFFAIAIYRLDDYSKASIPVLPVKKGIRTTKIQMVLYIIAFTLASSMLTLCGYTGYGYLTVASATGLIWLWVGLQGFKCEDDQLWARKMLRLSLIAITALCIAIPFSVV
ncbi:MAG: heme o synthase [Chlamydiota bacterium]